VRKGSEERWVFAVSGALRRLERVEDKYGRAIVLSYDGNGRLQSVMDRYGRVLGLEYQGARLWKVRDFAGRVWELVYGSSGRLERVRFPAVLDAQEPLQTRVYEIAFGYNSRGNVVRWVDRLGQVWRYGYTSATSDVLKWFRDPDGNYWTAYYSSVAQAVDIQSGGAPKVLETGSVRWVDPTGVWVEYGFVSPVVARITRGGNETTERLTTRLWHNGQYQVIKRQDPAGLVWEWSYDAQGNLPVEQGAERGAHGLCVLCRHRPRVED
jgi:YD repeat-containing protein